MLRQKKYFPILAIFLLGLLIRFLSIYPANTIIGFDQARDLFDGLKIIKGDIRIVGPTAGNNAYLHHGVAFLYYIIPPLILGSGNPIYVALWNSFFNALTIIVLYLFSKSLFKNEKSALITAFVASVSYYLIQFSGWLSNPTVTLLTVPIFFWSLWLYKKGEKKGLILSLFFLGISIQFEIFFLYLIPTFLIVWVLLKPKFPDFKTLLLSFLAFCLATSTMIATEIKFAFSGVKSLLFSQTAGKPPLSSNLKEFFNRFWNTFSLNLIPQEPNFGIYIGIAFLLTTFFCLLKKRKNEKSALIFVLIYLFSPLLMLLVGYHRAPWFLIGVPPAIALLGGYTFAKVKNNYLFIPILILIFVFNLKAIKNSQGKGQILLEPDRSSILSTQLSVIDHTYKTANNKPFAINTVTNPLYVNTVWAYNYSWYGKKYGFLPNWLGGDQIPPYNTLPKSNGEEEIFFLIIDDTPRIPVAHKLEAINWAEKKGSLIEKKNFEGISVFTYLTKPFASQRVFEALLE